MEMRKELKHEIDFENMQFDPQAPYEGIVNMLNRWFNNGHREELQKLGRRIYAIKAL